MYCYSCGAVLFEGSEFCVKCGVKVDDIIKAVEVNTVEKREYNYFGVFAFVMSILSIFINMMGVLPILSLVVSFVSLLQFRNSKDKGIGFAIAALCISIFTTLFTILGLIVLTSR